MDIRKLCLVFSLLQAMLVRSEPNLAHWTRSRQKRFLIWTDGGSTKVSISMSIPVNFYDKKKWRSFNLTFNIQFQYNMPHAPLYWWNKTAFEWTRSGGARNLVEPESGDLSEMFIYAFVENYMSNMGINGRQCLQRSICENAQVYKVEGLFERLYQRLLTPEESSEQYYRDAYVEGIKGVDCLKTYSKCPIGDSVFDKFVQYVKTSE